MKVIDIADEIYRELDAPSDVSILSISMWLRSNFGKLNNLLTGAAYELNLSNAEIVPEIGDNEKPILKLMYYVYYNDKQFRAFSGSAGVDSVLEITSDGSTVRMVNRNEVGKTFLQAKKSASEELKKLIDQYNYNQVTPLQVAGDDTESPAPYPSRYYSRTSRI